MATISEQKWLRVLLACGVRTSISTIWAPLFTRYVQPELFSLGMSEVDDFCGQVLHETRMLERLEEDLNYSAQRLCDVWPARFPTLSVALHYQFNPTELAEKVYGGRMGNTRPGDGWLFRGRGIPMVTGKDNYELLQRLTCLPLVAHPEQLQEPEPALRCAILWWEKRVPDAAIDSCERVTRAVNGGVVGLADRLNLTRRASRALAT